MFNRLQLPSGAHLANLVWNVVKSDGDNGDNNAEIPAVYPIYAHAHIYIVLSSARNVEGCSQRPSQYRVPCRRSGCTSSECSRDGSVWRSWPY